MTYLIGDEVWVWICAMRKPVFCTVMRIGSDNLDVDSPEIPQEVKRHGFITTHFSWVGPRPKELADRFAKFH